MRKDLIQKLSILKELKPDAFWNESNRSLLLLQVKSSGSQVEKPSGVFGFLKNCFLCVWLQSLPTSAVATFVLVFIFFGTGIFGLQASKDTKPGDSFYVAKRLNEKAQLALSFNDERKARLGLEFASNSSAW